MGQLITISYCQKSVGFLFDQVVNRRINLWMNNYVSIVAMELGHLDKL